MGKGGDATVLKREKKTPEDFYMSYTDEPHVTRRKQILAKHPEIEKLQEPDSRPIPYVVVAVFVHVFLAYYSQFMSFPVWLSVCWIIGGGITHSLSLMVHELSHNLVFKNIDMNFYFGVFCNMGMGLPTAAVFKRYHMEHHQFQGDNAKDVDIPTWAEGWVFRGILGKALWVLLQPITYAIRPGIIRPKNFSQKEWINLIAVITSNIALYPLIGFSGMLYLGAALLLGMGSHPLAGHLIAEHFVFVEGHETYSYYGPLNYFAWNVGYHNEHHDFPRVPGWKLPEVKRIAHEFYDDLPTHESWPGAIFKFIFDPKMSVFSRVRRGDKLERRSQNKKGT